MNAGSPLPRGKPQPSQTEPLDCEVDVLDGLVPIAAEELRRRYGTRVRVTASLTASIRFTLRSDLRGLFLLRSVIAAYRVLQFSVPRPKALLGHEHFERIVETALAVVRLSPHGAFRTLRVSAAGEQSTVLTRLKDELALRLGLQPTDGDADLLLRLRRAPSNGGWEVLVRVTPRPLATRAWRVCNFAGAPNAALAYAVMTLTRPTPHDEVLNLCCGSGTLVIERLAISRARSVIGCDLDPAALVCARQNARAAGVEREMRLEQWDATSLPLPAASVSVLCADLPFGQLVGSHRENEVLYPQIVAEATRVAVPGARMALLTHELRLLERAMTTVQGAWEHLQTVRVRSGGMTPGIFVYQRA
jgi:predicted nicotinamide N-methyase